MNKLLSIPYFVSALAVTHRLDAQGVDATYSWMDCTANPQSDADMDGVDDQCELSVAQAFAPQLVYANGETSSARKTYWAARKNPTGKERSLRIFYALSYLSDTGIVTESNNTSHVLMPSGKWGHFGDSEFIVIDVGAQQDDDTIWMLDQVFLSAHFNTLTDDSRWHPASDFKEWPSSTYGAPRVYVSWSKHANYVSSDGCSAPLLASIAADRCPSLSGCTMGDNYCTAPGAFESVEVLAGRNLGSPSVPLPGLSILTTSVGSSCADPSDDCHSEWYWDDHRFCGWQKPGSFDRQNTTWWLGGCVPAEDSYFRELNDCRIQLTDAECPIPGLSGACDSLLGCNCLAADGEIAQCLNITQLVQNYRQQHPGMTDAADAYCQSLKAAVGCGGSGSGTEPVTTTWSTASTGSNCNFIQNTAPVIERVVTAGSPPALPAAGDIAPGTYYLTSSTAYGTQGVGGCIGDTLQATLVLVPTAPSPPIQYGDFELATKSRINGELHASLSYATNGSLFAFALLCPTVATGSYLYTATPTEFRLEATTSDCAIVDVFTKQSNATDIGKADAGNSVLDASTDAAKDAAAPIPCTSLADCTGGFVCKASTCAGSGTCGLNACIVFTGGAVCGCDGKPYDSSCSAYAAGNLAYTTAACPRDAGN